MTMRLIRLILLTAALAVGLTADLTAQTVGNTTTFSAAVTATQQTVTVASATGFTVGNFLWADMEAMQITSVNGTTIGVQRGQIGTAARAHANARRVITGNIQIFQQVDPTTLNGTCARGAGEAAYSPWINVRTGIISMCGGSGGTGTTWTQTSTAPLTLNSIPTSF